MNPFNQPPNNHTMHDDDDEPISPRTIPHNYNAMLNNHHISTPHPSPIRGRSLHHRRHQRSPIIPRHPYMTFNNTPLPRIPEPRLLRYTGHCLGKHPRSPSYLPNPRPRKLRCHTSHRRLFNPFLTPSPSHNHIPTSSSPNSSGDHQALLSTFLADPFVSRLPLPFSSFTQIIHPPCPLNPHLSSAPFGTDSSINLKGLHPLLLPILRPRGDEAGSFVLEGETFPFPHLWRALQLASRFLTQRSSLSLFHELLFADADEARHLLLRRRWRGQSVVVQQQQQQQQQHLRLGGVLGEDERVKTTEALASLTSRINFCFSPTSAPITWAEAVPVEASPEVDTRRYPSSVDESLLSSGGVEGGGKGRRVLVKLNPILLRCLHVGAFPEVGYHGKVYALFVLAVSIVKAVADAVGVLRFGESVVGGWGRLWEESVFGGGVVDVLGREVADSEGEGGAAGDLFNVGVGWRGREGEGEVMRVVPFEDVQRFFVGKWWEWIDRERGGEVGRVLGERKEEWVGVGVGRGEDVIMEYIDSRSEASR